MFHEHVVVTYLRHENDNLLIHSDDKGNLYHQSSEQGVLHNKYIRQVDGKVFKEWKCCSDPYQVELVEDKINYRIGGEEVQRAWFKYRDEDKIPLCGPLVSFVAGWNAAKAHFEGEKFKKVVSD